MIGEEEGGVRLHHPELRSCGFTFEISDWAYPVPYLCSACETTHINKTMHLRLDEVGDVIVSVPFYERWREYLDPVFKVLGRVSKPEPITLGMNGQQETYHFVRMED